MPLIAFLIPSIAAFLCSFAYCCWSGTGGTARTSQSGMPQRSLLAKVCNFCCHYPKSPLFNRHIHYISAGEGLVAIVVRENGTDTYYYTYTDHLGSILTATNSAGTVVADQNFDPWGRKRNPTTWTYASVPTVPSWLYRGYTGHEDMPEFGLINMNGRLYDPILNRMLSADNEVPSALSTQGYNRYSYAFNNPLRYTDPDGEIIFAPILAGVLYGALIGAGTSAAVYTVTTLVTGQKWNLGDFGRSVAIGALGGALGGGFSGLATQLGSFGQSLSYNLLSGIASNSATTLAFGGDLSAGSLVGMVAGGFLGAGIGNFTGVSGGALGNIGAELAFGISRGAITGAIGGVIGAAIDGNDIGQGFTQGATYGAIAGGTLAGLNIAIMGAAYKPGKSYGDFGRNAPVYRRGTFLWPKSAGIALGRNLVTRLTGDAKYDDFLQAHETGHFYQQSRIGFGKFYGRTLSSYLNPRIGQQASYDTGGTLEFGANLFSLHKIGYFWSHKFQTYINGSNFYNYYPTGRYSIY